MDGDNKIGKRLTARGGWSKVATLAVALVCIAAATGFFIIPGTRTPEPQAT